MSAKKSLNRLDRIRRRQFERSWELVEQLDLLRLSPLENGKKRRPWKIWLGWAIATIGVLVAVLLFVFASGRSMRQEQNVFEMLAILLFLAFVLVGMFLIIGNISSQRFFSVARRLEFQEFIFQLFSRVLSGFFCLASFLLSVFLICFEVSWIKEYWGGGSQ
jgi:membrane-associated HD superfamily phosphohydrolase